MCGIAGIIDLNGNSRQLTRPVVGMSKKMYNRGPDDEGYLLYDNNKLWSFYGADTPTDYQLRKQAPSVRQALEMPSSVALAHRRLSIIDLKETGHQPLVDPTNRFAIIFNGEIYNYKALKNELEAKNYRFFSDSDTEVVLRAYQAYGADCVHQFNGMFAFAILDLLSGQVFIARDRIGIKPFFYHITDDNLFVFASDVKTLLASGLVPHEISYQGLWHSLSFGIVPGANSLFKGVYSLPQSHWMRIKLGSASISTHNYWHIPTGIQDKGMSEQQAVSHLEEELHRAINYRMVADVDVTSFMSGGIDSTLITAIASQYYPGISAFTIGFLGESAEQNEVEQARATARLHPIKHFVKYVDNSLLEHLNDIILAYEEPYPQIGPYYLISKVVREDGYKVALSGLGADELFAGYNFYKKVARWSKLRQFHPLHKFMPNNTGNYTANLAREYFRANTYGKYYALIRSVFKEFEKAQLLGKQNFDSLEYFEQTHGRSNITFSDDIEAFSYYDLMSYIGDHHVYRLDQFSMRFSLEARIPFLDHRLIEQMATIPSGHKLNKNTGKHILRKVAEKYISKQNLEMKKKGFNMPLKHWINTELKQITHEAFSSLKTRGVFSEKALDRVLHAGTQRQIWLLTMFEYWYRNFVDTSVTAPEAVE